SVRFPNRMCPSCVNEPTGSARPRRTASTPAMNVVATAPNPGVSTPRRPVAGAIFLPSLTFDLVVRSPRRHRRVQRHAAGMAIHPDDPLEGRQIRQDREDDDDDPEHHPVPCLAEEER